MRGIAIGTCPFKFLRCIMKIPNHVAIILDGNGRWAKSKGMPRNYGHTVGAKNVETVCPQSYGDADRCYGSCRNAGNHFGSQHAGRKIPERLHPLRYGRTLCDVRRSTGMGTDQPRGIWCQRREKGVYKICARCTAS